MLATSLALAVLAAALAVPVPLLLGHARWPARSPAVALILWQSIAIAGGLSMIGALLVFGLAPFGDNLLDGLRGLVDYFTHGVAVRPIEAWNLFALWGAVLLALHLGLTSVLVVIRSERQRRRHAQLVTLLSSPLSPKTRLLDTPTPVAYCLPGALSSITVFSAGLIDLLDDDELQAVVEHEWAHVAQRHDVVLVAFRAWNAALPWFPIASRAQREVGMLVEMLADDRARSIVTDAVLASAITLVGGATPSDSTAEAAHPNDVELRVQRFMLPPLPLLPKVLVVAAAAALLAVPTVLLVVPAVH